MYEDCDNIVYWYINESIINLSLYKTKIDEFANQSNLTINKTLRSLDKETFKRLFSINIDEDCLNEETIEIFSKLGPIVSLSNQTEIFVFTMLKALITSYFSIFEHFINLVGREIGIEKGIDNGKPIKEDLTKFIKRLFKTLGYGNFIETVGLSHFEGYKEFYLRRNLYVHEYGIITKRYLDELKNIQSNNPFVSEIKNNETLKVGNKLYLDSGYLIGSSISINCIGLIIGAIYLHKTLSKKEFNTQLSKIADILIFNDDNEALYMGFYSIISKNIDISKNYDFTLGYLLSLKKLDVVFSKIGKEDEITNSYQEIKKSINTKELDVFQLSKFYGIIKDTKKLNEITVNYMDKFKDDKLIVYYSNYEFLSEYLLENKDLVKKHLKKNSIKIKIDRNISTTNKKYFDTIKFFIND